ncbi:MAG TPA: hypothetical protein VGQ06_03275 [Gemmatimonadales bacterium]|jgi:hypothetical protein|nr:hypothetical protein [Gemmatimonadales bacterium]
MSGPNLGDYHLHLDPELEAEIRALQSGPPSPLLRSLVLSPDWTALEPMTLDRILRTPSPTTPSRPLVPRGNYTGAPRAADVGDLMKAIWAVPVVQETTTRLLDQAGDRARRDWQGASTGDRALVVTSATVLAGGSLAGVLSNNETRTWAFNVIVDKDIPVPGVDGLSVRLRPRGAGATYRNIGGSGVTVSASGQAGAGAPPQVEVMVTLDLARYLRNR